MKVLRAEGFDTDSLGTFDGAVTRTLSAKNAALFKAQKACELTGLHQGIGSEGSFESAMFGGILNEEYLAFVDISCGIEVFARVTRTLPLKALTANDKEDLLAQTESIDKQQKWNVKEAKKWQKGLSVQQLCEKTKWPIAIEPDFRAMNCPERRVTIAETAQNLLSRLITLCPKCKMPNFMFDHIEKGLPCALCNMPTQEPQSMFATCVFCSHKESRPVKEKHAEPSRCGFCNP